MPMESIANQLLSHIGRKALNIECLKGGLIHASFRVWDDAGDSHILQKMHTGIFTQPALIQTNIRRVVEHLAGKNFPYKLASFYPWADKQEKDNYWRMGPFFEFSQCLETSSDYRQIEQAVKALASFHSQLEDGRILALQPPIAGFLDFESRKQQYFTALQHGNPIRLTETSPLIHQMQQFLYIVDDFADITAQLGTSVIHGDPKLSNFLFNSDGTEVIAIIDLDTVQEGSVLYDLGDMIRSMANRFPEDYDIALLPKGERLLNPEVLDIILNTYYKQSNLRLKALTRKQILQSAACVIYIQAIRFLTDYIQDDTYYQIRYPQHNLVRATNQFQLMQDLLGAI